MAQQRRMIYGSTFANAELNMLPIEARYLYIGAIVLADDDGRLRADPRSLRGQIFSYDESITSGDVESWLQKLVEAGQIELYERDGVKVLRHPKWDSYQKIRQDMYVPSRLPAPVTPPLQPRTISKGKLNKVKEEKYPLAWLVNIPVEELKELSEKYEASTSQVKRKGEQFWNYCVAKEPGYKNHRAALENALDKDFGRRAPKKEIPIEKPVHLDPEEQERVDKLKREISSSLRVKA